MIQMRSARFGEEREEQREREKDRFLRINVISRRIRVTTVAVEMQQILHNLDVSVALVIQYKKRTRGIILSFVACPPLLDFYTLSHK